MFCIHFNVTVICEIDAGDDIGHVSSLELMSISVLCRIMIIIKNEKQSEFMIAPD